MRVDLWHGQGIAPFGLDVVVGGCGDGAAGPVGCGKELGFEAASKGCARYGHFGSIGERRALRVEDLRAGELGCMPSTGSTG
jgi:hypothetical protein